MAKYDDFQEIAHCGGQATFQIICDDQGRKSYSIGFRHSRPVPAAVIGVYALAPQGIPVTDFSIGGIGQGFNPPCPEGCFPVFMGSDSRQCWGHQCPRCQGYFRNGQHPAVYPLTCPYCGLRTPSHAFMTPTQRNYVRHYLDTLLGALDEEMEPSSEREVVIDMDAIIEQGANQTRPDFYYAAETQQTRYRCDKCSEFNDIRGRYGYCASCGWRNNISFLKASFADLRAKLNEGQTGAADAVRSSISEFDACCRDMAVQITKRIPMKPRRKADLQRLVFHDVESQVIASMKSMFDIDMLRGVSDDLPFLKKMMHRRHVFEHNAGVADARYIRESGDTDAREGVLIRETQANAHRLINGLTRMAENFEADFHEILQPTEWPINHHREAQERSRRH